MRRLVLALDVDGVIADTYRVWLDRWNAAHPQDQFDLAEIYSPRAAGNAAFLAQLSAPDLYADVQPIDGAVASVQSLRADGHRLLFVTSCVRGMADQKWEWLERHGVLDVRPLQHPDLIIAHDKSLIRADVLVDDAAHNFDAWPTMGLLFDAPYNREARPSRPTQVCRTWRVRSWPQVLAKIARLDARAVA